MLTVCNSFIGKLRQQKTGYVYSNVMPNEQNVYVSDTNGAFRISVSEPYPSFLCFLYTIYEAVMCLLWLPISYSQLVTQVCSWSKCTQSKMLG